MRNNHKKKNSTKISPKIEAKSGPQKQTPFGLDEKERMA
jgi:hypothetical protein